MLLLPHRIVRAVALASFMGLAATQKRPDYVYQIFHESSNCTDATVGVKGWVSGDSFRSSGGASNDICALEALCALNDTSAQCQGLVRTGYSVGKFTLLEDNTVETCDSSKLTDDRPLCSVSSSDTCTDNVHLPSCYSQSVSFQELKANPNLIYNPNPQHVGEQVYIVYYEDEQCQDFVGFRSLLSGPIDLHKTSGELDCYSSIVCSVDVHSESCKSINIGILSSETLTMDGGREVWSCNATGHCRERDQILCAKSVIHPSCSFRVASGYTLFQNPSFWLGESSAVDVDSGKDGSSSSASTVTSCYYGILMMASLFASLMIA